MIAPHPFSAQARADQVHLRLMETTDLHVHVFPYDYYSDAPRDTVGLSRTASHIRTCRAEAANAMLFDNGDVLQGNPMGDYIAYERGMKDGDYHPIIRAMNVLGYDAATIGNHEFNYGLPFLENSMATAGFPVVLANVLREKGPAPRKDKSLFPPYRILLRNLTDGAGKTQHIKVGVIGFTPPQIMIWDRQHLEGNIQVRDIVETARAYVPEMKEAGADIIIALSHSGIGPATGDMLENASTALSLVDGIDVVMTGHTHLEFPGPGYAASGLIDPAEGRLNGKPALMAGCWGSHLGVIDLLLCQDAGAWRIDASESSLRPISARSEDGKVAALVADQSDVLQAAEQQHCETLAYIRRAVGKTSAPLHSYFSAIAADPSVQIVADAQRWYITELLRGGEFAHLPVLSAAAPFKAGGRGGPGYYTDVPAGDMAIKHVADLYLYPNMARAVKVTGADLRNWLERSAGMFNQILPGVLDQELLNPAFPSYDFDVISGVTYQFDLSQPSKFATDGAQINPNARRVSNLCFKGEPVRDSMEFIVATNSYRAGGGGSFPGINNETVIFEAPDTVPDVIVRFIVKQGTINPSAEANWSFLPLGGATAFFETGPRARRYVSDLQGVHVEVDGDGANGFARFRISL